LENEKAAVKKEHRVNGLRVGRKTRPQRTVARDYSIVGAQHIPTIARSSMAKSIGVKLF